MRIGELAALSGASVRSLRYYEEHGLLSARRTATAQRVYDDGAVERVRLLKQLYAAGLNSASIASLLPCVDSPSAQVTRETLTIMHREHGRITDQIRELTATRDDLSYLIAAATDFQREQLDTAATPATT